jgi:hypothetical protein
VVTELLADETIDLERLQALWAEVEAGAAETSGKVARRRAPKAALA